jgi:hypothetical protein
MESQEMTSPFNSLASSTANAVFPEAVGPAMHMMLDMKASLQPHTDQNDQKADTYADFGKELVFASSVKSQKRRRNQKCNTSRDQQMTGSLSKAIAGDAHDHSGNQNHNHSQNDQ